MSLTHDAPTTKARSAADPPHHHCAAAIATAVGLMVAAVPALMWLVDQAFAAGR